MTVVNLVNLPSTELARECFEILPERVKIVTGWRSEDVSAAIEAAKLDYTTIFRFR